MDFAFSDEDETLRRDVRRFLASELPEWWRGVFDRDERAIPLTRDICRKLAERGWLTMSWPRDFGGADAGIWAQAVLREEMWAREEPRGPQYMNLNYIGPMIMLFGTPSQKERFLLPMSAGQVLWTQGFSEPGAGSDLASLQTTARDCEDHFVINGQKIWNSYADAPADWCILLARTDPKASKHKGLSVFLLDMTTPGVMVRPIDSIAGPHKFNEIFLDDVVVPHDCLLGEKNNGWSMVTTGLTFERIGIARYAAAGRVIEILVTHANRTFVDGAPLASRPEVRTKLADLYCHYEAARLLNYRAISMQAAGQVPAAEASIARIHNTLVEQAAGRIGLEILGLAGQLTGADPDAILEGQLERRWVHGMTATVAAGTLEIQKNIVAQRYLGLPQPN